MVGTHLLPPQLLKLFAPRAPLPYLKPTGRDPDLPLKSRAHQPPTLGVSETLASLREERELKAAKEVEEGEDKTKEEGEGVFTLTAEEAYKLRVEEKKKHHVDTLELGIKNC